MAHLPNLQPPMPGHWLLKTEPSTYSYSHLEKDGRTTWDGVRNNLALMHLRAMRPGDQVLIYHSGAERAVVGEGRVLTAAVPEAGQSDPRFVAIDVAPVRRLSAPVPLSAIKGDPALAEMALVRNSRLSVMPLTPAEWARIVELAAQAAARP